MTHLGPHSEDLGSKVHSLELSLLGLRVGYIGFCRLPLYAEFKTDDIKTQQSISCLNQPFLINRSLGVVVVTWL